MEYRLEGSDVVILAVAVWFVGTFITNRVAFLRRYSIPVAVTGGLLFSGLTALLHGAFDVTVTLDLRLRDLLLLSSSPRSDCRQTSACFWMVGKRWQFSWSWRRRFCSFRT